MNVQVSHQDSAAVMAVSCLVLGLLPWNAMPGKACGMTLAAICKASEVSPFIQSFELPCLVLFVLNIGEISWRMKKWSGVKQQYV